MKKILFLFIVFLISLSVFSFDVKNVNAQLSTSDIILDVSPEHPSPREEVVARVNSYATDLNKTNIVWMINNQIKAQGIGKNIFYFNVEDTGVETLLSVSIETIDGQNVIRNYLISPVGFDLIWEAYNSYTPPFYKGKALIGKEAEVKVVAIPNFQSSESFNSSNFLYTWKKDNKNQQYASGWGKSSFIYKNSYLERTNTIEMLANNIDNTLSASKRISIGTYEPKIVFYAKDKDDNVLYNNSVRNNFLLNEEKKIIAIPYFFSMSDASDNYMSFTWFVDGSPFYSKNEKKNEIVLSRFYESGEVKIGLNVNNTKTLFQEKKKEIVFTF